MDLDGDGHRDILSGSYSRMDKDMAGLFQVLRGKADGTFEPAEALKGTDGEPLIIATQSDDELTEKICTRPFAVDWNGDGHLDLVVGNFAGTFYLFKGRGKGQFDPKAEKIMAGGKPLRINGAHSDPFVVDWDGDGDLDIVSGTSQGGVYWAENKAGKGKVPEMTAFKELIKPGAHAASDKRLSESDLTEPSDDTRVWVEDVDGDGKLDILVGDTVTLVSLPKGVTEEESKKKLQQWQKEITAAIEAMRKAQGDQKAQTKAREEYTKLYKKRAEFIIEEMTGFVWLYRQK